MERIIYIDYMRLLRALRAKISFVVTVMLVLGLIGAVGIFIISDGNDKYTARSSVYTTSTNEYGNAAEGVQYAEIVKSMAVAESVKASLGEQISDLSATDIYSMIEVVYDNDVVYVNSSAIIDIFVTADNATDAALIADSVAVAFVDVVSHIADNTAKLGVLDVADSPEKTVNARKDFLKYTAVFLVLGFVIGCLIVLIPEILCLRLVTVRDGTLQGRLDLIGAIPYFEQTDTKPN